MVLHLKKTLRVFLLFCLFVGLTNLIFAQTTQDSLIKDFKWRNIGPANMIGRISDFEALESDFTQVLVASVRNPIHVLEAATMGADIITMPFKVISQLVKHPLTDIGIEKFLKDWKKVNK